MEQLNLLLGDSPAKICPRLERCEELKRVLEVVFSDTCSVLQKSVTDPLSCLKTSTGYSLDQRKIRGNGLTTFSGTWPKSGYDAEWFCLSASSVGAAHLRERLWVVAYPNETQLQRGSISLRVHKEHAKFSDSCWGKDKPGVVRTSNGVPSQMDRLGCLGNAVVPKIPEIIGLALDEAITNKGI